MKGRITEKNNIEDTDKNIEKNNIEDKAVGKIILRIREMLLQKIQQEKIRFLKR